MERLCERRVLVVGASSGIGRAIAIAAAAEGARAAATAASDSSAAGWVAALLVEGALVAADKPDTRSWIFLPEQVLVHRGIRAYRLDGDTNVITLGYNKIMTRKTSLDLSYRYVDSEAKGGITYDRSIVRFSLLGRF